MLKQSSISSFFKKKSDNIKNSVKSCDEFDRSTACTPSPKFRPNASSSVKKKVLDFSNAGKGTSISDKSPFNKENVTISFDGDVSRSSRNDAGGSCVEVSFNKRRKVITLDSDDDDCDKDYIPNNEDEESESVSSADEENISELVDASPISSKKRKHSKSFVTLNRITSPITPLSSTRKKIFSPNQSASDCSIGDGSVVSYTYHNLSFLNNELRDSQRRLPSDPNYDSSTLFVPQRFLDEQTPAQRQWWIFKSKNFDKILFFKLGKFYELFHMDAEVGVTHCGLIYMKGDMAHCGFPEAAFNRYSNELINKGFRVARIEQTETPAKMEQRCREMSGRVSKFDRVVKREICQVVSLGTRALTSSKNSCEEFQYLLSIVESPLSCDRSVSIGVCFVDVSLGQFNIGQFTDDVHMSRLRMLLAYFPPVEILIEKGTSSTGGLSKVLNSTVGNVAKHFLKPKTEFWEAKKVIQVLTEKDYFCCDMKNPKEAWPRVLIDMLDEDDPLGRTPSSKFTLAWRCLGAITFYLSDSLIERDLFAMKDFTKFIPSDFDSDTSRRGVHMVVDHNTIFNLDILPTSKNETKFSFSLFSVINRTCTPFGKRLLRQWMCSPLLQSKAIRERQDAIRNIHLLSAKDSDLSSLINTLRKLPDLERLVGSVLLWAGGNNTDPEHPESRAIYFDNSCANSTKSRKKVLEFIGLLEALEKIYLAVKALTNGSSREQISASILKQILFSFPDIEQDIAFFHGAFDRKKVLENGGIIEDDSDSVCAKEEVKRQADDYLRQQSRFFGCEVRFTGTGKNAFQLEVPDNAASKYATAEYNLSGQARKGFKRFCTSVTKRLLEAQTEADLLDGHAAQNRALKCFKHFAANASTWHALVEKLAILDALLSLHIYSYGLDDGGGCFPTIIDQGTDGGRIIKFEDGKHPILASTSSSFIPNDLELRNGVVIILTGANMGGKSTLMRQTALLVVLAQMGSAVPARSMTLCPIDRIFTRIGASDNLFGGESTFFVELSETSVILKQATLNSLVLMDELGRGTTTQDGVAIADAVLRAMIDRGCATLFSTHYHELTRQYAANSDNTARIKMYYMAYMEDSDKITFLYKCIPGLCPQSHGFNAASLAGVSSEIVNMAKHVAEEFAERERIRLSFLNIFPKAV